MGAIEDAIMFKSGTEIRQKWKIPDGFVFLSIKTSKPMDASVVTELIPLVEAIETFVAANTPLEADRGSH